MFISRAPKIKWDAGLAAALAGFAGITASAPQAQATVPDDTLVADLSYMREEERFARDVYTALAEHYDQARPFSTIKNAEQRHLDAIGALLTSYGIDDPSEGLAAGDYAYNELDQQYASLVANGTASLPKAYAAGVTIETQDIADLEAAIARTAEPDALRVFQRLLSGSENHLRAFSIAAPAGVVRFWAG